MAAPERFAKTSDSSCNAGAVHTWRFATFAAPQHDVGCPGVDRTRRGHAGNDAIDPNLPIAAQAEAKAGNNISQLALAPVIFIASMAMRMTSTSAISNVIEAI
jgi:hypothetical protein